MSISSRFTVRDLTAMGMAAALALVLGYLMRLVRWPQGGSVTLETVPLLYLALWRGPRLGVSAGLLCSLLNLMLDAVILHPVQLLLDYPLALAFIGLSGFWPRSPRFGILVANSLRATSHIVSGVVFFGSYAPEGMSIWRYSIVYNLSFVGPETLIGILLVPLLLRRLGHVH